MKRFICKIKFLFIFSVLLLVFMGTKVRASTLSISTSKSSVSAGESFTVTVSVGNGAGYVTTTVTNGSGGGTTEWIDSSSYSFTCIAGSSGTVSISASGTIADYSTEADESKSAFASVAISSSSSGSTMSSTSSTSSSTSNATSSTSTSTASSPILTNLGITPYDFSGFKGSVTSYSVTVPNECSSVTIYASADSGNTVSGTGTVTLKEGTNKYIITVSNSSGSTSYALSIIRETLEGDDVANSIEDDTETDEETEEILEGIGLAGLVITGYELDPEFDTSIYEYEVIVDDELTLEELEEIKSKITAITNADTVYTEIAAEVLDDGSGVITIIVKDGEKEYSTYIIYFEQNDAEVVTVAGTTTSNDSSLKFDITDLTKKIYIVVGCIIISILTAIIFAIIAYQKSKRLKEFYDSSNHYDDYNDKDEHEKMSANFENDDFSEEIQRSKKISDMLKDDSKIPELANVFNEKENNMEIESETFQKESISGININDEFNGKTDSVKLIKDTEEKLSDLREYKKMRKGFSRGGKH